MPFNTPKDVMPWVGLYVAGASLACTLAMAADALQGFRQWKLWFPNRYFVLNSVSITLIAIAMKLPVDLNTDKSGDYDLQTMGVSIYFLVAMLANILPSLGLMNDKELLLNMVAWGILGITITVNVWIHTFVGALRMDFFFVLIFSLLWVFSVALTVPANRRILENRYKKMHGLASRSQEIEFSFKELVHDVKKYWMMADTGNPQFALACSEVSCAFGVLCSIFVSASSLTNLKYISASVSLIHNQSDYEWSTKFIIYVQIVGIVVGSIAPILRCWTSISYFSLSNKLSKNHLNVFRVEKHWIQLLHVWKHSHVSSHIPGRHCKIIFRFPRNIILNFLIALQVMIVVMCKTICLVPIFILIIFSSCWYLCKSLFRRFKKRPNVSSTERSELEEYTSYVLQIEDDAKLSPRVRKNTLNSITQLIHVSEKKRPKNLLMLLEKSTGFRGVVEFDYHQVPLLTSEEIQKSWSLVAVTLTAIALALPNIASDHVNGLLVSMREGLQLVRHIEENLNANDILVTVRKASKRVGIEVELYRTWLQIDLQKMARKGKTSKDILQWLGDEAAKTVILFKSNKNESLDHSFQHFIAASSMYRISQTILIHCNEQDIWPRDEEVFERVSRIIADILYACFTNLPHVITMMCHKDAIEKRQDNIRTAAQILGKSKKIIESLKGRKLPNLDIDSMAYLDKWHALPKSEIPSSCASSEPSSTNF